VLSPSQVKNSASKISAFYFLKNSSLVPSLFRFLSPEKRGRTLKGFNKREIIWKEGRALRTIQRNYKKQGNHTMK